MTTPTRFEASGRVGEWPPEKFRDRNRRVAVYDRLWGGHLAVLGGDRKLFRIGTNPVRRVIARKGNILLMTEPVLTPDGTVGPLRLRTVAGQILSDMMRYGAALIQTGVVSGAGGEETFVRIVNPASWYPTADDGYVQVLPYTDPDTDRAVEDKAAVFIADAAGRTVRQIRDYRDGQIGDIVEEDDEWGMSYVLPVFADPEEDGWGTSLIDDMIGVIRELGVRKHQMSHILNANAEPTLVFVAEQSSLAGLIINADYSGFLTRDQQQALQTPEQTYSAASAAAAEAMDSDVVVSDSPPVDASYVQYDGNAASALAFMQYLREDFFAASGLPEVLYRTNGLTGPSGESLKRQLFGLYADTMSLQLKARAGLETALNQTADTSGAMYQLEWANSIEAFEDMEMDAEQQMIGMLRGGDSIEQG